MEASVLGRVNPGATDKAPQSFHKEKCLRGVQRLHFDCRISAVDNPSPVVFYSPADREQFKESKISINSIGTGKSPAISATVIDLSGINSATASTRAVRKGSPVKVSMLSGANAENGAGLDWTNRCWPGALRARACACSFRAGSVTTRMPQR